MKQTKMMGIVFGLVLSLMVSKSNVLALTVSNIRKVTIAPTITVTPIMAKISPTESATAIISPTISPTGTTATSQPTGTINNNNMTFWFLVVTIGLLAIIIIVQAWPRKDNEE